MRQFATKIMIALFAMALSFSVLEAQPPEGKGPKAAKEQAIKEKNEAKGQQKAQEAKEKGLEAKEKAQQKAEDSKAKGQEAKDKAKDKAKSDAEEKLKGYEKDDHPGKGLDKPKSDNGDVNDNDDGYENDGQGPKTGEDHPGKGHGYGKDKGDLSGKEFGQQRAAEAKAKHEEKLRELKGSLVSGEDKIKEARDKIAKAREGLVKEKSAGTLSEVELEEKTKKIDSAEKFVQSLEEKLKKARALDKDEK